MNAHDVVITGIGLVSSLGEGADAHWSKLTAERPEPVVDAGRYSPYVVHPLGVAKLIADLKLDVPSVCAGLLHDCVEDTSATAEDIGRLVGPEVQMLVEGVTKLGQIAWHTREERQAMIDGKGVHVAVGGLPIPDLDRAVDDGRLRRKTLLEGGEIDEELEQGAGLALRLVR